MALIAGFTVARDATGNVEDLINGTFRDCMPGNCTYGLQNNFQVSNFKECLKVDLNHFRLDHFL